MTARKIDPVEEEGIVPPAGFQPPAPPVPPAYPVPPAPPAYPYAPALRKPGKVQAIAIMTLISGILNVLWGLSAAVSIFVANFFACYWAPYALTLGVLEIIYSAKLLGSNPRGIQPAKYLAIMQIVNITTVNPYSFFIGDVVMGILALVFYDDQEVRDYFARINA